MVTIYQTMRCHILEDSSLDDHILIPKLHLGSKLFRSGYNVPLEQILELIKYGVNYILYCGK
jgi:hypothetical protein